MRKLYEVFLVHKETEEVKHIYVVAGSDTDACTVAVVREAIVEADLPKWVKLAKEIMAVGRIEK